MGTYGLRVLLSLWCCGYGLEMGLGRLDLVMSVLYGRCGSTPSPYLVKRPPEFLAPVKLYPV